MVYISILTLLIIFNYQLYLQNCNCGRQDAKKAIAALTGTFRYNTNNYAKTLYKKR